MTQSRSASNHRMGAMYGKRQAGAGARDQIVTRKASGERGPGTRDSRDPGNRANARVSRYTSLSHMKREASETRINLGCAFGQSPDRCEQGRGGALSCCLISIRYFKDVDVTRGELPDKTAAPIFGAVCSVPGHRGLALAYAKRHRQY